jgi:hypothetical protein
MVNRVAEVGYILARVAIKPRETMSADNMVTI